MILNTNTNNFACFPFKRKYRRGVTITKENNVSKYHIGGLKSAHKSELNTSIALCIFRDSPLSNNFPFIKIKPNAENIKYGISKDLILPRNFFI